MCARMCGWVFVCVYALSVSVCVCAICVCCFCVYVCVWQMCLCLCVYTHISCLITCSPFCMYVVLVEYMPLIVVNTICKGSLLCRG